MAQFIFKAGVLVSLLWTTGAYVQGSTNSSVPVGELSIYSMQKSKKKKEKKCEKSSFETNKLALEDIDFLSIWAVAYREHVVLKYPVYFE